MKIISLLLLISLNSFADESVDVGCVKLEYYCLTSGKCDWWSKPGEIITVELSKKGDGPSFEIWVGNADWVLENQSFHIDIYQRREASKNFNYLTIDLPITPSNSISVIGKDLVQVKYTDDLAKAGTGIRCTTEISSVP